ncbi:MAG TPA: hypothetical protein VFA56_05605 [Gaiellaceae bacterium]|nr:hypothetical protein [Gaiellaceae bacterium]
MNLLQRIRAFWGPEPQPDHPLSEEERQKLPADVTDEAANIWVGFYGHTLKSGGQDE